MHLTADAVAKLRFAGRRALYFDTKFPGFGVIVAQRRKRWIYQRDVNGKTRRVTIGYADEMSIADAREHAHDKAKEMRGGKDPNAKTETFGAALIAFAEASAATRKRTPGTVAAYRRACERYLGDWLKMDLADITRPMCNERHRKVFKDVAARNRAKRTTGCHTANFALRVLHIVFAHAMKRHHERLKDNPTNAVDWYAVKSRKEARVPEAIIVDEDLRPWYAEVSKIANEIGRDYLLFVLLTGMRRSAAAAVRWQDVDLARATLHVPKPKGGEKRAFTIPLSDRVVDLLRRRAEDNEPNSPWVFPARSASGHVEQPPKAGSVMVHGLRHTYATAAQRAGVPMPFVSQLLNHALPGPVMTDDYVDIRDVEHLRPWQQKITDRLWSLMRPDGGKVVEIATAAAAAG
jgi:integrase